VPYPCHPLYLLSGPPFRSPAGDDVGHPGPLRAPVEVLDADVPPGSRRAQAEGKKDGLVLTVRQTAQAEGRMKTAVEGDGAGRKGPLLVLGGPLGRQVLRGARRPLSEGDSGAAALT